MTGARAKDESGDEPSRSFFLERLLSEPELRRKWIAERSVPAAPGSGLASPLSRPEPPSWGKPPLEFEGAQWGDYGPSRFLPDCPGSPPRLPPEIAQPDNPVPGPRNLLFAGSRGRGKSRLAALYSRLWGAAWVNAVEIDRQARARHGAEDPIKRAVSARVLVLDDLLAVSRTPTAMGHLYAVVNGRIGARRPTIVTINEAARVLEGLSRDLASRLGSFELYVLCGRDWRQAP